MEQKTGYRIGTLPSKSLLGGIYPYV